MNSPPPDLNAPPDPPSSTPSSLDSIRAFRWIDQRVGTAGQPDADQFRLVRDAGFEAVINLALPTSNNALPNEGSIVTGLGMTYAQVPVNFQAPTARDFAAFCGLMDAFADRRVFVHCALNMRVSAFMFLHRVLRQGTPVAEARRDLDAIWQPDEIWQGFIEAQLASGHSAGVESPAASAPPMPRPTR